MTLLLVAAAPSHVIVDNLRTPGADTVANAALVIAVITLLAVFLQILIANKTLDATMKELELTRRALEVTNSEFELANKQLTESQKASELTRQALESSQEQNRLTKRERVQRERTAAPIIVADDSYNSSGKLYLEIKGALATSIRISCSDASDVFHSAAANAISAMTPGERRETSIFLPADPGAMGHFLPLSNLRIRYKDGSSNAYMMEYAKFYFDAHTEPTFRKPWLGKHLEEPPPDKHSDKVSWPVEHFERLPGVPDEPLDNSYGERS